MHNQKRPRGISDFSEKILIGANSAILCLKMMHPHNLRSAQGFLSFHQWKNQQACENYINGFLGENFWLPQVGHGGPENKASS